MDQNPESEQNLARGARDYPRIVFPFSWRHLWSLARDPATIYRRLHQLDPAILRLSAGSFDFVLVAHPPAIADVLKDPGTYSHETWDYRALRPLIGDGLLTISDTAWRARRQRVGPLFMNQAPRRLAETSQVASIRLRQRLQDAAATSAPLDLYRVFLEFMLSAVSLMLMGRDLADPGDALGRSLLQALEQVGSWRLLRFLLPMGQSQPIQARRQLQTLIQSEIRRRRIHRQGDLLQQLIDNWPESPRTERELCDEVMTLLFTSQISPAAIATWGVWLLENHPQDRARVTAELNGCLRCPPTLEDLPRFDFSQAALAETLRLYPAVWGIPRVATTRTQLQRGTIHRGDQVMALPYAVQRDPRCWPEPDAFRPERFLNAAAPKEGTYLPFGIGPRSCIGAAATKVLVVAAWSTLFREFRFESDPRRPVTPRFTITLHPGSGYWGRVLPTPTS